MDNVLKICLSASSGCYWKEKIVVNTTINGANYEHRGEKYFTIGVFYEANWNMENKKELFIKLKLNDKKKRKFYDKNQDILQINPNYKINPSFRDEIPYYFIDDVCIEKDTTNYK